MLTGYEHVNVNRDLYIQVNDVHQLYVADCGNPKGVPVVFCMEDLVDIRAKLAYNFLTQKNIE